METITETFKLYKNNSYQIRFYCDLCDCEIMEDDQKDHLCGDSEVEAD